jgi:hypothetical protein
MTGKKRNSWKKESGCSPTGLAQAWLRRCINKYLLVAVVGTYNPYSIAVMCLSTAVPMFVGAGFKRLMAERAARKTVASAQEE